MNQHDAPTFPVGIGQLSSITGCSPETIRYYERQGLLPKPDRSFGGHRQYQEDQLRLLQFILSAKQLGFGQPDVRRLLRMADPARTDCTTVHGLASQQLADVRKRLRNLRKLERTLRELIEACETEGAAMACPMIDALLDDG